MSMLAETATLAHGFTMAEIERIARSAAYIKASRNLDDSDAYEAAWYGVVERLYANPERPEKQELIWAGIRAIEYVVYSDMSTHGVTRTHYEAAPNFLRYWGVPQTQPEHQSVHLPIRGFVDFTDGVVERMALPQVLGLLTAVEYEAVATLAAHSSVTAAARALNVNRNALAARLDSARRRILAVWLAPETPVTRPRAGDEARCTNGHLREGNTVTYTYATQTIRRCRLCARSSSRRTNARKR
jgi:hypothetical protein